MRLVFQYLYYFFSSVKNRGLIFTLKLMYNEWKWERKLGISTLGIEALPDEVSSDQFKQQQFHHYQGASFYILFETFKNIPEQFKQGSFIDFGCGKGRVMIVAALSGFNKIIGLDIDEKLISQVNKNLSISKTKYHGKNFNVLCADVTKYEIPDEATVMFFFNPFGEEIMKRVCESVLKSLERNRREILIVYVNPKFLNVWKEFGAKEVFSIRSKKYQEVAVLNLF